MPQGPSDPLRRWARHLRCIAATSGSPDLHVTLGSLARELEQAERRRPDQNAQAALSAATPGSALPSSHSRNAPPAVET
jgi:hypothetical protein